MPAVNLTVYWPPLYRLILAEVLRHRWRLGYLTFFAACRFLLVVLVVRVVCPDVGLLHLTVSVIIRC